MICEHGQRVTVTTDNGTEPAIVVFKLHTNGVYVVKCDDGRRHIVDHTQMTPEEKAS